MTALRELLDAQAATTRRAVVARSRRQVHLGPDPRQLVVYQYAANDFSVIGLAYGRPGHRPDHVVVCSDPLNRDQIAAQLKPVRDDLLTWLDAHPVIPATRALRGGGTRATYTCDGAPQLVIAGTGVVKALDNLAYDWRYNPSLDADWHRLGEELWTLCDLAKRPGQSLIVPLAEQLAEHYAFGISVLEAAKLAVLTALLDAGPAGLSATDYRTAELAESGPLGRPDELDEPVWEAVRGGRRPPPIVRTTLRETWERCNRGWAHLAALPEAAAATAAAQKVEAAWAERIGLARTGSTYRRRRALPTLAAAANELATMERDAEEFTARAALEDPMFAAELASDHRAYRARLAFTEVALGPRKVRIEIVADTTAPVPPTAGARLGIAHPGPPVNAEVTAVTPTPGSGTSRWRVRMHVDAETVGVRAARLLTDGDYWLVPVPKKAPPGLGSPRTAPLTHPAARGGTPAAASVGAGAGGP